MGRAIAWWCALVWRVQCDTAAHGWTRRTIAAWAALVGLVAFVTWGALAALAWVF